MKIKGSNNGNLHTTVNNTLFNDSDCLADGSLRIVGRTTRTNTLLTNNACDNDNIVEHAIHLVRPELVSNTQCHNGNEQNILDCKTTRNTVTTLSVSNYNSGGTISIEKDLDCLNHSDLDDMPNAPRGIVNPNYPGFQHLAHTLQDYSSSIENFYSSDNDMTDDDIEIADVESESRMDKITKSENSSNNNISNEWHSNKSVKHRPVTSDNRLPDLIKTLSKSDDLYENKKVASYFDTDIDNNFSTEDIIGNFNKEIEDEIKLVLNYNINIQDDLDELRKDIKDNLAKPIEHTINNISDVVNEVIKKLVEGEVNETLEHNDVIDMQTINSTPNVENVLNDRQENDSELMMNRPTFLDIEIINSPDIADAILSDGKEDIHFSEDNFNTEIMNMSVENTIQQLSAELKKIIPKLEELRERDKIFSVNSYPNAVRDGNCNQIARSPEDIYRANLDSPQFEVSKAQNMSSNLPTKCEQNKLNTSKPRLHQELPSDIFTRSAHSTAAQPKSEINLESFDVYNIETALPKLDIDVFEYHLKLAQEAERRKRNDREEIRRRLAMGADTEDYHSLGHTDRPGKKPSLQSRLQSGMNLQICFMNETASDNESQASDVERSSSSAKSLSKSSLFSKSNYSLNNHPYQTRPLSVSVTKHEKITTLQSGSKLRPSSLSRGGRSQSSSSLAPAGAAGAREGGFAALQSALQTEARVALAQAKELARAQMERERRGRAESPVSGMLRRSLAAARAPLAPARRRVSRQLLTDINVAQLQVIVNELHTQIESLNESLVRLLMSRDELHMSQDSMLVDIEDLTRYLGVKEQAKKSKSSKSGIKRLTSFVR